MLFGGILVNNLKYFLENKAHHRFITPSQKYKYVNGIMKL